MKLPPVALAQPKQLQAAGYGVIQQEAQAREGLINAAAGVAESFIEAEATAEFITGKADYKRQVNNLHRGLARELTPVSELGDVAFDASDVKSVDGQDYVPTYTVGAKLWQQESDRIYKDVTGKLKHQRSKNEFTARWSDANEASRDSALNQMETGAKEYHRRTKESEIDTFLKDGDVAGALESVMFLERERSYNAEEAKAKRKYIGQYVETSNVYDLVNTEDVDGMKAEKERLRDKDGKYTGPHNEKERASLIATLDRGLNESAALKNSSFTALRNSAADYSANRLGDNDQGYNPAIRASIESFEASTPAQEAAKNESLRELDIVDAYADRAGLIETASPDDALTEYNKALDDTKNIKDYRARAAAESRVRQVYARRNELLRTDPARYAINTNDGVNDSYRAFSIALQSNDDIGVISELYNEYKAKSDSVQGGYGVSNKAILPKDFSTALNAALSNNTLQGKMDLAMRLQAIGGADTIKIANEIGGENPSFTQGMIELADGSRVNAEAIFRGMDVENNLSKVDLGTARVDTFGGFSNTVMSDANIKDSSTAITAWYLGNADEEQKNMFDDELWAEAQDAIVGPIIEPNKGRTSNTLSYKDASGQWVDSGDFNGVVENITNEDILSAQGVSISVGGISDAGEILDHANLVPAGADGEYYLVIENSAKGGINYGSQIGVVKDSDGNDFVLNMQAVTDAQKERLSYENSYEPKRSGRVVR